MLVIVSFQQALQSGPLEIATLKRARIQQQRTSEISEAGMAPKPISRRQAKAVFLLGENLFGQKIRESFFENIPLRPTFDLQASRDPTGGDSNPWIEIGIANFDTLGFGHAVDFKKVIVGNRELEIDVEEAVERANLTCPEKVLARDIDREVMFQRLPKIIGQELSGMIAVIELVGKEPIHRGLVRFANIIFDFAPGIEARDRFRCVIEHAS